MAREVHTGDMVAHLWAHQSQDSARRGDGRLNFSGRAIYSYGSHFLAGYMLGEGDARVALINSDSYSISTSRHMGMIRGAVRHMTAHNVPSLSDLRDYFNVTESRYWKEEDSTRERWRVRLTQFVTQHAQGLTPEATAALFSPLALPARSVAAIYRKALAERVRLDAKEAADSKRAAEQERLDYAKHVARMTPAQFAATFPRDADLEPRGSKPWEVRQVENFSRKVNATIRQSSKLGKRDAASLRERVRQWRAHKAGMTERVREAYRQERRDAFAAWVQAGKPYQGRPPSWKYGTKEHGPAPFPGFREAWEALTLSEAEQHDSERRAAFDAWQAGGPRPSPNTWAEGTPERQAIDAARVFERVARVFERVALAQQWRDWRAGIIPNHPPASPFFLGIDHDGIPILGDKEQDRAAWLILCDAEAEDSRRERAAKAAREESERAEKLAAWFNGAPGPCPIRKAPSGGAYLRIRGDQVETSEGAQVPLAHAIRAFKVAKALREKHYDSANPDSPANKRDVWKSNGRVVRVGHFTVDAIQANGSFRAGCHFLAWPDIERAALAAGVFDEPGDLSGIESRNVAA